MKFYCFVAIILATTGLAHAYNLAQKGAGLDEEAIYDDHQLAETYGEVDQASASVADDGTVTSTYGPGKTAGAV